MRCMFCGHDDSKVLDSRPVDEGRSIRRRRECLSCGKRFTTYERVEELPLVVVKNDGSRELFDPNKILNGLLRACDKRAIPTSILENVVADVERELSNNLEREVSSKTIGELVIKRLRSIDQVAYVRFASVYRKFEDVSTFIDEIRALQKDSKENEPASN
ncbi:MAG: transcriptional regulator NrdR [Bacillota bacterium]|nr:transcriptional regulator NrdR [Bacillota bacterium]